MNVFFPPLSHKWNRNLSLWWRSRQPLLTLIWQLQVFLLCQDLWFLFRGKPWQRCASPMLSVALGSQARWLSLFITFTCWRMIAGFRCIIVLCFINLFIKMYFRQETRRTAWLKTQKTLKVLQANRNLPPCLLNPLLLLRHKQQLLQQQGNYAV